MFYTITNILAGIVVILFMILTYVTYKMSWAFGVKRPWWFSSLPYIFFYGLLIRIGVFLITLGVLPIWVDYYLTSLATIFWVGLTAFICGLYYVIQDMIEKPEK